jgi:hypothetical protein
MSLWLLVPALLLRTMSTSFIVLFPYIYRNYIDHIAQPLCSPFAFTPHTDTQPR